jgi:hypothetical protein
MFRPPEESFRALLNAVKDYEGPVAWVMHDDCIGAFKAKPTGQGMVRLPYSMSEQEIEKHNQSLRQAPDPTFVERITNMRTRSAPDRRFPRTNSSTKRRDYEELARLRP